MDSPVLPVSARGWLEVQELYECSNDKGRKRGESPQKRWVVLDNGVLWIRRSPKDLAFEGSLPMMNAVIERLPEDRRSTLRVRMRGSDREFCLRCEEGEDLSEWEIALTEARRRWAEKRRASALFRAAQGAAMSNTNTEVLDEPKQNCLQVPEINSLEKSIKVEQARVQRISPPVATRTLTQIVASEHRSRKSNEGKTEERRKSSLTKGKMPSWKELPEIINTGLPESLGVGGVKAANVAFQLAASEAEYNMELNLLNQLGKRIVVQWNDDPSPSFLRRAVAAHIQRMKALSDSLLTQLESLWAKRPTLIGVHALYARAIADFRAPYVAYSGHIEDIMLIIQRALEVRPDALWAVSGGGEGGFERRNRSQPLVIAPLQRLTTLRIMLQECTSESIRLREEERANAVSALDTLKEILDESYAEMTTQSGTQFVAEVDNLLDFDEMSSGRSPLSLLLGDRGDDDRCQSDEDDVPKTSGRQMSRPSIFWN